MIAKEKIFREYDIRGVVGEDFDAGLARQLGRAFAEKVIEHSGKAKDRRCTVGVGRDCRLSGPELLEALTEGLVEGGVNVLHCGMGPTPQLYYSVYAKSLDGGIQVTGSHNPSDQNGFKMMIGHATLSGNAITDLKNRVLSGKMTSPAVTAGTVTLFDAQTAYLAELIERSKAHMGQRRLRIVVDGGNGVGGMIGPELLRALGCEVIELFTEPDGHFPNHHPDPTVLENIEELCALVRSEKADIGIGYDGDADRIGVVDEHGEIIFGDMLLLLFGRQLAKEIKKPIVIGDVKCSEVLFTELARAGAEPVMAKTGHSLIKAKIKELGAQLAGEMSGHMFFVHRYFGFDDALHASARLVEILSNSTQSISEMFSDLPKMISTPELRLDCPDELKFNVISKAQASFKEFPVNTLDGVRVTFPNGWGLVRASNTQSVLVMRFEADTAEHLAEYRQLFEDRIAAIRASI